MPVRIKKRTALEFCTAANIRPADGFRGVRFPQLLQTAVREAANAPMPNPLGFLRMGQNPMAPNEVIKMALGDDLALIVEKIQEKYSFNFRAYETLPPKAGGKKKMVKLHEKAVHAGVAAGVASSLYGTSQGGQCGLAATVEYFHINSEDAAKTPQATLDNQSKCWLCGGMVLPGAKKAAEPNCEHILPALSAAMLRGLYTNLQTDVAAVAAQADPSVAPRRKNIINFLGNNNNAVREYMKMTANNYLWSHQICNGSAKSARMLIDYNHDIKEFVAADNLAEELAQRVASGVGQRAPYVLYGGDKQQPFIKALWSKDLKPPLPLSDDEKRIASAVRDILFNNHQGHYWPGWNGKTRPERSAKLGGRQRACWVAGTGDPTKQGGQQISPPVAQCKRSQWTDVPCGDRQGCWWYGDRHTPYYTAYNGTAYAYRPDEDGGKWTIIFVFPQGDPRHETAADQVANALKSKGKKKAINAVVQISSLKYAKKGVSVGTRSWDTAKQVYKHQIANYVSGINSEFEKIKDKVGDGPQALSAYATYCKKIVQVYLLSESFAGDQMESVTGVGRGITQKVIKAGLRSIADSLEGGGQKKTKGKKMKGGVDENARVVIIREQEAKLKEMAALQLYFTQEWSNIDYDILKMTNTGSQGGGGHRIQKGGGKTITQSQILNFFTYLLLGNNTDKVTAVMNVSTDSDILGSLWLPPRGLGDDTTQLPESVVAVTCQIMSWLFIWLKYEPKNLKKYVPSQRNSAIGTNKQDVKAAALAVLGDQTVGRSATGYTGSPADYDVFIDQICCLLNSAFRFIEASNLEGQRPTRSNYGKVPRNAALKVMGCGPNLEEKECLRDCNNNVNKTAVGKTLYYKAIMTKIRETIGWFSDSPQTRAVTGAGTILGNIRKCLKRYYCDEKWVEFGLDKQCNPERSVSRGGYKRTKKKRRRRHTRRRRRRRKRKTRHRKQRRRRKRRTRR